MLLLHRASYAPRPVQRQPTAQIGQSALLVPVRPCQWLLRDASRVLIFRASGPVPGEHPEGTSQPSTDSPPAPVEAEAAGAVPVVEASNVLEDGDAQAAGADLLPRVPDTVTRTCKALYTGLAVLCSALAVTLASAAVWSPNSLLVADAAGPAGATLLGCSAAALLQAAGLLVHLRQGVAIGELATWRLQRASAAVGSFGVLCTLAALPAALTATPLLTGSFLLSGAALAASCVWVARESWRHGPWAQWAVIPGDVEGSVRLLGHHASEAASTLAALVCVAWLVIAAHGAAGVLLDPAAWAASSAHHAALYPYATTPAAAASLDVLRRVCGAGLILSAATAHALLEAAQQLRIVPLVTAIKETLLDTMRADHPELAVLQPPLARFAPLAALGVTAAGGLQAAFLLHAPALGMDVNKDAALMAPLHWTVMIALLAAGVAASRADWETVGLSALRIFNFFGAIVSGVVQTFVLRLEWTRAHKL